MSSRPPCTITDAGIVYRVFDAVAIPGEPQRVVAPGHPRAHYRIFEAPDRTAYMIVIARDPWGDRRPWCPDAIDLSPAWLLRQLGAARGPSGETWGAELLALARAEARTRRLAAERAAAAEAPVAAPRSDPLPANYIPRRERGVHRRSGH